MLEPHRSRYLRALGVDVYVPREPLPGAAIAEPLAWDVAFTTPTATAAASVRQALTASVGASASSEAALSTHRELADAQLHASTMPVARAALAELQVDARPAGRSRLAASDAPEPVEVVADVARAAVPRFSILVARCDNGIVVIDEGPRPGQRRADHARLLGNLLFALYRRPISMELDLFVWPMVKNPLVDQSEQAARESFGAYLQRQCSLANGKRLVALGAGPTQWLNSDPSFHVVTGISLWRCLADGGAKQTLWQQLQPLRASVN